MLELAIVLPLLLLIVFGTISYGVLLYDQAMITNAAREGARWQVISTNYSASGNSRGYTFSNYTCGSQPATPTLPQHVACNYLSNYLINFGSGSPSVSVSNSPATAVGVTVSFHYTGLGLILLPAPDLNISASSVMYYE